MDPMLDDEVLFTVCHVQGRASYGVDRIAWRFGMQGTRTAMGKRASEHFEHYVLSIFVALFV